MQRSVAERSKHRWMAMRMHKLRAEAADFYRHVGNRVNNRSGGYPQERDVVFAAGTWIDTFHSHCSNN